MKMSVDELVAKATHKIAENVSNKQRNQIFITNEDFTRTDPTLKRLLVLGCSGSGKSSLLNKLSGLKLEWNSDKSTFIWNSIPIFESKSDVNSVTKYTTYANINFPDERTGLLVVDTPGHDHHDLPNMDSQTIRDKLSEDAADLYNKLKNMGHLNTILVLHNDIYSNRLNPATFTLLQKIDEMFVSSDINVWEHVVIAYSKCDGDTIGWKSNLVDKKTQLQQEIKNKFPKCQNDIPIYTLSSVELGKESDDYKNLANFINSKNNLSTHKLVKFKGLDVRLQDMIERRDYIQRMANARLYFNVIKFQFTLLIICILFRNIFLPIFNLEGVYDEVIILTVFIYIIGPFKFIDWLNIIWTDYLQKYLNKLPIEQFKIKIQQTIQNYKLELQKSTDSDSHIQTTEHKKKEKKNY